MSEYFATKMLNPNKGFSCAFRNWRATHSHCRWVHGYDLVFQVTFAAAVLDERGWVIDFGAMGPLKEAIEKTFDHKLLVAEDDPHIDVLSALAGIDCADVVVLPHVGCEAFSLWLAVQATDLLAELNLLDRVRVRSALVYEHGANAAGYQP